MGYTSKSGVCFTIWNNFAICVGHKHESIHGQGEEAEGHFADEDKENQSRVLVEPDSCHPQKPGTKLNFISPAARGPLNQPPVIGVTLSP